MAVYDLEEQEKLDDLKAWWEQNSKYVTAAVVAVAKTPVDWPMPRSSARSTAIPCRVK